MRKLIILLMIILVLSMTLGATGFCEMRTSHDSCGRTEGAKGECVHGAVCCALAPFAKTMVEHELPAYVGIPAFMMILILTSVSYVGFNSNTYFFNPIDPLYRPPQLISG